MPDLLFNLSKYGAIQREALSVLHGHTKNTIKQRREVLRLKKQQNNDQSSVEDDLSAL